MFIFVFNLMSASSPRCKLTERESCCYCLIGMGLERGVGVEIRLGLGQ